MIGVDSHNRLVYEGSTHYGHGVWPTPFIAPAFLIKADEDWLAMPQIEDFGPLSLVFREDSFDAVTRVRRGRLYQAGNSQPAEWHVQQHPAFHEDVGSRDSAGRLRKTLHTFHIYRGLASAARENPALAIVIGAGDSLSLWSVVLVERNFIGEDLLTLRARSTLGVLPALIDMRVPQEALARTRACLEAVTDAVYRAGPTSVIDRCRDAAQAILAAWLARELGASEQAMPDLAALARRIETIAPERQVLACGAKVIARLHARGKPNEQLKRSIPAPTEADAAAAVALLGLIMRELGWGER